MSNLLRRTQCPLMPVNYMKCCRCCALAHGASGGAWILVIWAQIFSGCAVICAGCIASVELLLWNDTMTTTTMTIDQYNNNKKKRRLNKNKYYSTELHPNRGNCLPNYWIHSSFIFIHPYFFHPISSANCCTTSASSVLLCGSIKQ